MGFGKFLGCIAGGAAVVLAAPITAVVAGAAGVMAASEAKKVKDQLKMEGYSDGYQSASYEYENKLVKQAEEFLKQKRNYENISKDREKLIDEYEKYIREKEAIISKLTDEQKKNLAKIKEMNEKLKKYSC